MAFSLLFFFCSCVIFGQDATTGQKTFRFADVHEKAEITAMAFDAGCRRLITGGRGNRLPLPFPPPNPPAAASP